MDSVKKQVGKNTCAVFIELIQGEGGVLPLAPDFVKELSAFCKERDILLMIDEVQTGVGRTGRCTATRITALSQISSPARRDLPAVCPWVPAFAPNVWVRCSAPECMVPPLAAILLCARGALAVLERVGSDDFMAEVRKKENISQKS